MGNDRSGCRVSILSDYFSAWNAYDADALMVMSTGDAVYTDMGWGHVFGPGARASAEAMEFSRSFSSDLSLDFVSTYQHGATYSGEWEVQGTHDGCLLPLALAATGKRFVLRGAAFLWTVEDAVGSVHSYWNPLDLLRQLGLEGLPVPDWDAWG